MSKHRYALWLCDKCGDHAEVEPGDLCEVCRQGTVHVVPVVPVPAVEAWIAQRKAWTTNTGRTPSERTLGHVFALDMLAKWLKDREQVNG